MNRVVALALVVASLSASPLSAQTSVLDRFVGTWTLDVSQQPIGAIAPLRFRVTAKGELEELRGPALKPLVQPVVFSGKPYKVEQGSTNLLTWKQIDANNFERTLSQGTQVLNIRRLRMSPDGKTLTHEMENRLSDGRTVTETVVYQRTSTESHPLAGTWKPESRKGTDSPTVVYERVGNGLKSQNPIGATFTVMLDGKPVPETGPTVIPGITIAAKQVDDYTIEFTQTREGAVTQRTLRKISPDGRTMTVTTTNIGAMAGPETVTTTWVKKSS